MSDTELVVLRRFTQRIEEWAAAVLSLLARATLPSRLSRTHEGSRTRTAPTMLGFEKLAELAFVGRNGMKGSPRQRPSEGSSLHRTDAFLGGNVQYSPMGASMTPNAQIGENAPIREREAKVLQHEDADDPLEALLQGLTRYL